MLAQYPGEVWHEACQAGARHLVHLMLLSERDPRRRVGGAR